jgi:hypothetical protein
MRPPTPSLQSLRDYLAAHAQTPVDYVLSAFNSHSVVLLAEDHAIRHNLALAHSLIPRLYQAGITNFGMEFGASEDQPALDRLVTARRYDRDTARRLMYNYNVGWAYREYMDLYHAAWQLNRSLPRGARPFRILNLGYRYNWAGAPAVRTPENACQIYPHGPVDAYRAEIVRRQVLERGEKIAILTGTVHAFTRYHIPFYDFNAPGFVRFEDRNLGQLLYRTHREEVFCILLHQPFEDKWEGGARLVRPAGGLLDEVLSGYAHGPVGFDLADSPFGDLPDDSACAWGRPDFRLAQLADGYIYDRPFEEFEGCTIDEDFLSEDDWPAIYDQIPDPDWRPRPTSLDDYWAEIRAYADLHQRYATLFEIER